MNAQPWLLLCLASCSAAPAAAPAPDLAWGSTRRFERVHWSSEALRGDAQGPLLSPVFQAERPFDQVLASWNAQAPAGSKLVVELRVAEREAWSPWLWLADWGALASGPGSAPRACRLGQVQVDAFAATRPLGRVQLRFSSLDAEGHWLRPRLSRVDLCLRRAESASAPLASPAPAASAPLELPRLSQRSAPAELAARICSPTSVAMVLGYYGQPVLPAALAALAYDPWHDLYGNWPRNIQSAWSYGVPGYLTCFESWEPLEKRVRSGQPVIISIRVAPGALPGAPYTESQGHLLVVVGFDGAGGVIVHDPAAPDSTSVRRVYGRRELGRCWFGHGGVAYVLAAGRKAG